jgi:large subunit ribosomal protein L15
MKLNDIKAAAGPRKKRTRKGRGRGSGKGKTCGTGANGQRSRSGDKGAGLYEGGQMPLFRRLPKRGFNNANFAKRYAIVNVGALDVFEDGQEIGPAALVERRVISQLRDGVKILGGGELHRRLTVRAHRFSASAAEKIQAAGGTVVALDAED